MKYSIEQQKAYLDNRLVVEPLCSNSENKDAILKFTQATKGSNIADYLLNKAWQEDKNNNTKVFLVKDKETGEIAFFYAVNCGILYNELSLVPLKPEEKKAFNKYVEALRITMRKNASYEEINEANDNMYEAMEELWDIVRDPDRVERLFSSARDKANTLSEKDDSVMESEEQHIHAVKETYPAVDIKYFGRNKNYDTGIKLDFRLGVYVFWEIIVPYILKLAQFVGCKYVYLFAADRTNFKETENNQSSSNDMFEDEDNESNKDGNIKKLVNYYINELRFQNVTNFTVLKPYHERGCYTLIQEIDTLEMNRKAVWDMHTSDDEDL